MDIIMVLGIGLFVLFVYQAIEFYRETTKNNEEILYCLYMMRETLKENNSKHKLMDFDVFMGRPPRKPFVRQLPLPGFERAGTWEEYINSPDAYKRKNKWITL